MAICRKCGKDALQVGGWLQRMNPTGEMGIFECRPSCDAAPMTPIERVIGAIEYHQEKDNMMDQIVVPDSLTLRSLLGRMGFPTIVCLCGSTRFMEAYQDANLEETLAGRIVLSVGCNTKSDADLFGGKLPSEQAALKEQLDRLHKQKIDLADEILVLNVDGYIGESTRSEIAHAKAQGKTARYLEPID